MAAVSVNWYPEGPDPKWGQIGYGMHRDDTGFVYFRTYIETNHGLAYEDWSIEFQDVPEPGMHHYQVELDPTAGEWRFCFDHTLYEPILDHSDTYWETHYPNHVSWFGETFNTQDHLVGTYDERLVFGAQEPLGYTDADFNVHAAELSDTGRFPRRNDAPTTYGLEVPGDDEFQVWDTRD